MSAYQEFLEEKQKLDAYIGRQFRIHNVVENLSGATIELVHPGGESAVLQLLSADARKYMSNLVVKQLASSGWNDAG
ncbi:MULTISPECIES: hypothetical protein [unclassified Paenibacillus]|uniref:hypothetical protein n=1 Tax=unclassified Paenibacillus TaxID=185978 RepID=UPI00104A2B52|nr:MULTISPECIES: hypothetical protein [unclassified Paenibacillus]NIK70058.1 hypothetical protein [Paenibacillus sp. BK720]TCM97887.1 hypothetical protein EV294_103315 [Paenibacillus sp. BK033]